MDEASEGRTPAERLASLLDVAREERGDRFVGSPGRGRGRLFGGLVAAQALVAAGRTADGGGPHSLHAYFLRPGSFAKSVRFWVERVRDGRTFATRRVTARQGDETILTLAASFAPPEEGIAHQDPAPEAPPPESLRDWDVVRAERLGEPAPPSGGPLELRACDPEAPEGGVLLPPRKRTWMRSRGPLPDDPLLHAAALVYASDRGLLGTGARPHGIPWRRRRAASLDHAVWLHRPPRFEGWLLYACESPVAHAARSLNLGAFYDAAGRRIATVVQEGLVRERRDEGGRTAGPGGASR